MDSQDQTESKEDQSAEEHEPTSSESHDSHSEENGHSEADSTASVPHAKKTKRKFGLFPVLILSALLVAGAGTASYFFIFKAKSKGLVHKAGAHKEDDHHAANEHSKEHSKEHGKEHDEQNVEHADKHAEDHTPEHSPEHSLEHSLEHSTDHSDKHAAEDSTAEHSSEEGDEHASGSENHAATSKQSHEYKEYKGFFGRYLKAFHDVQSKVDAVKASEEKAARLELENASLRVWVESLQFNCQIKRAEDHTKQTAQKLYENTGSEVGRTLANIRYRPPAQLLPVQLYTLGVSYFKAREDEKAAVILTFLSEMEDHDLYRTPKNLLLAGVSWYRLENYSLADQYFTKVLGYVENEKERERDSGENLPYYAQARLWKGLVSKRLGKPTKTQFWLKELVDHHPKSVEATWINGRRGVASVKEVSEEQPEEIHEEAPHE